MYNYNNYNNSIKTNNKRILLELNKQKENRIKHYIEIFLSNDNIKQKDINKILLDNKILCNIIKYNSVVFNKKQEKYKIEKGFKINIFEISNTDLFNLYFEFRNILKINCIWINIDNDFFNNCITKYKPYLTAVNNLNLTPILCSEYL